MFPLGYFAGRIWHCGRALRQESPAKYLTLSPNAALSKGRMLYTRRRSAQSCPISALGGSV